MRGRDEIGVSESEKINLKTNHYTLKYTALVLQLKPHGSRSLLTFEAVLLDAYGRGLMWTFPHKAKALISANFAT